LEVVLVARDDAAATQAQIVKVDGEADDFAGNPTFNFGACGTGGIPPSHVVDRVRVDGQCTFTVNFVTDEPGPPEVGKEDNDKTTWRLDVFVHADKRAGELVNTASASAFIVVGDAGTVPEPTSFALIAMGGLLVCLPRVLASIRSGIVGALVHERNGG